MSEVVKPSSGGGSVQPPEVKPTAGPVSAEARRPEASAGMGSSWWFWAMACIGAGVLLMALAIGYSLKKRSSSDENA